MRDIEDIISPLIETQFPSFYKEEGPVFIEFVKAYYEWMETEGNALAISRDILELKDIDQTIDDYIQYFKTKYLPLISFNTATDKRFLVKHVLDLYRSKGTERSVDLFFRLVYGVPASVYFPSTDIFRLSNGKWVNPKYIEITNTPVNASYVGKTITGVRSGATAFCQNFIRKKIHSKYVDILYIDNIIGNFETGEIIVFDGVAVTSAPYITGSVTSAEVTYGSYGYEIGDQVTFTSDFGVGGIARVAEVADISGTVTFTLADGGWGFTNNATVHISDNVMDVSKAYPVNSNNSLWGRLETITQPRANIVYISSTGTLANNTLITEYYGNGSIAGTGKILTAVSTNSTAGYLSVAPASGNLQVNTKFYTTSNVVSANVSSYTDLSSYALFLGKSANQIISVTNATATFATDEILYQSNSLGYDTANASIINIQFVASTGNVTINSVSGAFLAGNVFSKYSNGLVTGKSAIIADIATSVGLKKRPTISIGAANVVAGGTGYSNTNIVYFLPLEGAVVNGNTATGNITTNSTGGITTLSLVSFGNNYINLSNIATRISNSTVNTSNTSLGSGALINVTQMVTANMPYAFTSTPGNYMFGLSTNTYGNISSISTGTLAGISISSNLQYTEVITTNDDMLARYASKALNASTFGFPANTSANVGTNFLSNIFSHSNVTVGKITSLTGLSPGTNYSVAPYILIDEPSISQFHKTDYVLTTTPVTGSFLVGEVLTQNGGGRGVIKSVTNSTMLTVRRISWAASFTTTGNTMMVSSSTGSSANVTWYDEQIALPGSGENAVVTSKAVSGAGSVISLDIIDSGFGYIPQESVRFNDITNPNGVAGEAMVHLDKNGYSKGFLQDRGSQLSSDKYLFDGEYYQEYSYDVRAAITLDRYTEIFKNTIHLAGTKFFGSLVLTDTANSIIQASETKLTLS